ncbi:MAG: DMT family transporter [Hyphomicrobiales bacterium]|jgi:drug/metabolite transporter (DMT)-like permease|nr:DMT family transporter [Hyphomicrobiales bacterium]
MPKPSLLSPASLGLLLGLLGVVAFGGTFPMTKLAVAWFDPVFVTFGRAGIAGLLALIVIVVLRKPLPDKHLWLPIGIAALCLVWGFPGLTNFAMRLVESSHAGVVAGILPLGTAVAAAIILREPQSRAFWAISILGMLVVVGFAMRSGGGAGIGGSLGPASLGPASLGPASLGLGDILVLISVAVASTGYVYSAKAARVMPGWEVISWILVVALPINLAGMALSWPGSAAFTAAPISALAGFAYVTVISQYVGFFFWNAGLAMGGVARVGQVQLLQTFITLIFAATLAGETVEPVVWLVAVVVVALVIAAKRVAHKT